MPKRNPFLTPIERRLGLNQLEIEGASIKELDRAVLRLDAETMDFLIMETIGNGEEIDLPNTPKEAQALYQKRRRSGRIDADTLREALIRMIEDELPADEAFIDPSLRLADTNDDLLFELEGAADDDDLKRVLKHLAKLGYKIPRKDPDGGYSDVLTSIPKLKLKDLRQAAIKVIG